MSSSSVTRNGSKSWFELEIIKDGAEPGTGTRWLSHYNEMGGPSLKRHVGVMFGPDHEPWTELRPGDSLGVWARAQGMDTACITSGVKLCVWEWIEPKANEMATPS